MVSVQQFETIPELAGNPFLPRLFQMFDADKDSKLTQAEFNSAIDYFLKAQTPEDRIKCAPSPLSSVLRSCVDACQPRMRESNATTRRACGAPASPELERVR